MANSCEFKTAEASTKSWLRTRNIIDKYLNILDLNKFRTSVTDLSNQARAKYGVTQRLFSETPDGKKAIPNKEAFKTIDQAKGIYYQTPDTNTETSKASAQTISLVKDLLTRIGVKVDVLTNISVNGVKQDINGVADIMQKLVQVTQDKLDVALPEEAMHFVVEILEQTDPGLFNQLLKEINSYEMFSRVIAEYGKNPLYQTADGKPDIRKLKKEAIAKVLTEVIIDKNEGSIEKPDNLAKVESWWQKIINAIKNLFIKSGFDQAAMKVLSGEFNGSVEELRSQEMFLQVAKSTQQQIVDKVLEIHNSVQKTKDGYLINGIIPKRVTDFVKDWYESRFADKALLKTEYQQAVDDLKAEKGTGGHADFENMLKKHFLNEDREFIRNEEDRPSDEDYTSQLDPNNKAYYQILKANMEARLASFPQGTKFLAEMTVFDGKNIAGTIDFMAITPESKVSLLDWKFMDLNVEKNRGDVPWYKVRAWREQMGLYKKILTNNYNINPKDFEQTRMIPIKVTYLPGSSKTNTLPKFAGLQIGSVDVKGEERAYLLPVGLESDVTGNKKIDALIEKLNKVYDSISERRVTPEQKDDKNRQLNELFSAIRQLQVRQNVAPLVKQAKILNAEVKKAIDEYNSTFKDKDPSIFTRTQKNEFSDRLLALEDALDVYKDLSVELKSAFQGTLTEDEKELWNDIRDTSETAKEAASDLRDVYREFSSEVIAKSQNVLDFLLPEKVVKGFNRWFASTSTIQLKSTEILYKLANRVFGEAAKDTLEQSKILQSIKKEYDTWAKKKGLSAKNYFDIIKKKGSNHLIDEYNPEFYTELKNKTIDKDYSWIRDNVDKEAYAKFLEEYRNKQYERIKNKARFGTEQENLRDVQTEINDIATLYNVTSPDAPGWLIYDFVKKFPKQQWESKEWIELNKPENAPAKRFYDYIRERNEEYDRVGYINSAQSRTFLPFVRKSLMEKIVMGGQVKLGEELLRQITISEGDVGYGKIDPITKEPVYSIPKYFTKDTGDEVSDDLFRNMALLNEMAIRYQYLSEIEGQMRLIARVESNKEAIKTSYFGKTKYKSNGDPETTSDNKDNTELLRHMMEAIVYGHKYVESENFDQLLGSVANFGKRANKVLGANVFPEKYDEFQISLNKSLTTLNNFFQLKTLGLNPLSALSSLFGGSFQSIINAGTYFTKSEFLANEFKIAGRMKGADAKKHLAALEYFLPLTENYNAQISRQLSLGATPEGVQEILMSLMRNADQYVQTVNFFSYLDNTIVVDGKLVNAREYLRKQDKYQGIYNVPQTERDALFKEFEQDVKELVKEKGVMNVATLSDNNSLVIPGVDGKDDSVFELRRKVQALTKDALGNLTDDDIRKINLNIIGKSFMIFKNWIPRLVDVRIGNLKYNSATDAYEWGRSRMVMNILSDGVLKSAKRFIDITQMNDDGIAYVREMFEKKREEYEKETGKPLRMTEQEFIDLVRKNVKDQAVDLVFYLTLTSMFLALKAMAPDDKDDKLAQNRYKFMLRAVDKIRDEISYFYNPTSLVNLTKSGIFPSTGLITNFVKMFENFGKEMYYIGVDDVKAQEKNQVVKYFLKGFPVTYEFDLPLLLFFPDVAKDLGMKAQGEARPIGQ